MAPLTWRNVSAPDLGNPIDALRLSGTLLDRGFTNLNESIGRFSTWKDDQNARLVNDAALRIQDPAQLREALASGTLLSGMPGGSLTPAAMEALQGRAGTLLTQAQQQENLTFDQANNPTRLLQGRATLAGTEANTAETRQRTTQSADLHPGALALQGFNVSLAERNNQAGVADQPGRLRRIEGDQTAYDLAQTGRQEAILRDAQAPRDAETAANIMRERQLDTGNVNDARDYINSPEFRALTPGAQRAVQAAISTAFPGAFGPTGTAVPGAASAAVEAAATGGPQATPPVTRAGAAIGQAAGAVVPPTSNPGRDPRLALPSPEGTHGTQNGSSYDVTYGNRATAAPITTMPISDVLTLQDQYVRNHGNSPMGAFQINRDTLRDFAPRVLGENWRSIPFTPEVQDRIGRAIFEERRGRDLTDTWAALPRRDPGAYANMSWEQIRGEISRREARTTADRGATPTERAQTAFRTADDISLQQDTLAGQNRRGSLVPGMREAANSTESLTAVAARVRQQSFGEEDSGRITNELTRLTTGNFGPNGRQLTPAEAGLIMQQGGASRRGRAARAATANDPEGRGFLARNLPTWAGGEDDERLPLITTFDQASNTTLARQYANGDLDKAERNSRDIGENQTLLRAARTRAQEAYDEVLRLRSQVAGGRPQLQGSLDRAEARLDTASEALHNVNQRLSATQARVAEESRRAAASGTGGGAGSTRGGAQAATPGGSSGGGGGGGGGGGSTAQGTTAAGTPARGFLAREATPEGPTRGARVAAAAGGTAPTEARTRDRPLLDAFFSNPEGSRVVASPEARAQGPGGGRRAGTVNGARAFADIAPEGDTPADQAARAEVASAGMFDPRASGGRQANEAGVSQAGLALALASGAAGGLGTGARAGATALVSGAPALATRVLQAGGRLNPSAFVDPMVTRALAAGGRAVPQVASPAAQTIAQGAAQVAPRIAAATSHEQAILQNVIRQSQAGAPVNEAILGAARNMGVTPEVVSRIVQRFF